MAVRHSPIVGIFDERGAAEGAIEQLHNAGFNDDQICYSGNVSANPGGGGFLEAIRRFFTGNQATHPSDVAHELSNMGLSDDEAQYYSQQYEAGRSIVAVSPGGRYEDALNILRLNGAYSYRPDAGSNQVATSPAAGYNQAAGAMPDNPQQPDYVTQPDYSQSPTDNSQAANYNQMAQTPDSMTGSPQLQQSGYAPQSDYNVANYNPQAVGYSEQQQDYGQGSVNLGADEERRRRLSEERREDTVTDADSNP
jgi:hypothetical protein